MSEDRVKYGTNDDYREIGELLSEVQEKLLRLDEVITGSRDKSLSANFHIKAQLLISSCEKMNRDYKAFMKERKADHG